jgi:predicted nucleic acid-binding protein
MRVIDTSVWIEWLVGSPLGKKLAREIPDKSECIVPTIVQLELAKWLAREVGEDQADQMIAYTQKCVVAPLDTRVALLAAELHRQYKLATADAVVYATARDLGAELLTCDAHFENLSGVVMVKKSSSA